MWQALGKGRATGMISRSGSPGCKRRRTGQGCAQRIGQGPGPLILFVHDHVYCLQIGVFRLILTENAVAEGERCLAEPFYAQFYAHSVCVT